MDPVLVGFCMVMTMAGAGMGLFSGLAPGIHVNTLAAMLLTAHPALVSAVSGRLDADGASMAVCCCIMSASVVHSFVDFVPSVFIGAPDGEDAVSVLPGHRLLRQGRGMVAVRAAAIGSLVGASAAVLMSVPLQWLLLNGLGDGLERLTPMVLLAAAGAILASERRRGNVMWGAAAFAMSGMLGLACMTLEIPMDGVLGEGSVMLPMLTGLFGIPVLLESSSSSRMPEQRDRVADPVGMVPGLKGVLMGTVAGWFPGITSTVGASMSAAVFPEDRPERFISTVASIGTVTAVLSLVTLSVSGNGRSGTALAIGEIAGDSLTGFMSEGFLLILLSTAAASLMGYWLTVWSGRTMSGLMGKVDAGRMNRNVIAVLVAVTLALTGPYGVVVLACSTLVGLMPGVFGTGRIVLCGCLLLPVLMFEFGYRSLQLRLGLGHELGVVHHEPLVGAGADLARGVGDCDPEHEPPPVDLHELGDAGGTHADGGGGGVGHVQMGADGAGPLLQVGCHALAGGGLDERYHGGGREHLQRPGPQGLGGVGFGHFDGLLSSDSRAEHGGRILSPDILTNLNTMRALWDWKMTSTTSSTS